MDNNLASQFFFDFGKQIIDYLPSLLGGIILLLIGWFAGWLAKRIIIQLLALLRFERLLVSLQWRRALLKADIRYAVFNLIGNAAFSIVFLVFLISALDAMRLTALAGLIQQGVVFIPRLIVAFIIIAIGWIVASRVSNSVYNALLKENVTHYSIVSRFVRFITVLFFTAMALVEIDIAIQIVIIGFTTIMITMGVIAIALVIYGGKSSTSNLINGDDKTGS